MLKDVGGLANKRRRHYEPRHFLLRVDSVLDTKFDRLILRPLGN